MKEERAMTTLMNALPAPKQIRFVNNQGQPPSKRRRINAACLTCRKRKTRCAGERPACSTCSKNGHVCLGYNENEGLEKKKEFGLSRGLKGDQPRNEGSATEREDDFLDDNDGDGDDCDVRRHWKSRSGRLGGGFVGHESPSRSSSVSSLTNHHSGGNGNGNGNGNSNGTITSTSSTSSSNNNSSNHQPQSHEWEQERHQVHQTQQVHPTHQTQQEQQHNNHPSEFRKPSFPRAGSLTEEELRSSNNHTHPPIQHHVEGKKVPYFRYFGPTAIVPGFKQMVVNVSYRDRRRSRGGSFSSTSPNNSLAEHRALFATSAHMQPEYVVEAPEDIPYYDNDSAPVHPLILSLVNTFFIHLGCNYPFLRHDKFVKMVREKRVEPILVDAVCALATRFSDLPIFAKPHQSSTVRSDYGHFYANRAKEKTVETFPCPTVGAVQAFLLMAYESFGQDQDSALWMYLGLAIRMAVDLGLQKRVGVKYQGEKDPWFTRTWNRKSTDDEIPEDKHEDEEAVLSPEEQSEVEQERIDTFWAVFVLDRVISSGTGRPVTFKDDDFEFPLPQPTYDPVTGFPAVFPIFIQIIHIYGRVSDILNNIRNPRDLTPEKLSKLVQMENELTTLYQKQDHRLHFDAYNFQEYAKMGQGTTFILLHFWFHALIIILHQPTLSFGTLSRIHQLLPNSRELSISSAKTIADILSFAELIDPKSFIGNPFTSQPMYIAACAFLMQSGAHSSEPSSPEPSSQEDAAKDRARHPGQHLGQHQGGQSTSGGDNRSPKHSLLALGANQNYQRCYKSLQQLHTYWGGVKYILTALDQKSKGIWDCETYTNEEYESTKEVRRGSFGRLTRFEIPASPNAPPIAYSLTGTTNSPSSSLTLLYQNANANTTSAPFFMPPTSSHTSSIPVSAPTPPGNMIYDPIRQSLPEPPPMFSPAYPQANVSALRHSAQPQPPSHQKHHRLSVSSVGGNNHGHSKSMLKFETVHSDEDPPTPGTESKLQILAGMAHHSQHGHGNGHGHGHGHGHGSPPGPPPPQSQPQPHAYNTPSSHSSTYEPSIIPGASPSSSTITDPSSGNHQMQHHGGPNGNTGSGSGGHGGGSGGGDGGGYSSPFTQTAGLASGSYYPQLTDLTFDSQEIDIGSLGLPQEMMPPWLEYLPNDVLGLFEGGVTLSGTHMG